MYHTLTKEEIYTALDERHSPETQKLLSAGNVAIAGLGGLGSNVAYALARIGVGHLHLIDFDVVDITNLNRQQYFMEHIGMYKTDALKSLLLKINPYLDIRTDCVKVTDDNLQELFADTTIVCEAFDNPEAKAMLVNGILEHFPEKKLVSATGMAGYGSSNTIITGQNNLHASFICVTNCRFMETITISDTMWYKLIAFDTKSGQPFVEYICTGDAIYVIVTHDSDVFSCLHCVVDNINAALHIRQF